MELSKLNKCLEVASSNADLGCHVIEIERLIAKVKAGHSLSVLEIVWIDYFLN